MKSASRRPPSDSPATEVRLDRLLGRQVLTANHRPLGRLEEFRAERHGEQCTLTDYVIGAAGLLERLGIGVTLLFGRPGGGYVARWDQLDISDPGSSVTHVRGRRSTETVSHRMRSAMADPNRRCPSRQERHVRMPRTSDEHGAVVSVRHGNG